jgi:hypothetical protein
MPHVVACVRPAVLLDAIICLSACELTCVLQLLCAMGTPVAGCVGDWHAAAHFVLKHWLMADYLAYYLLLGNYQVHGHHQSQIWRCKDVCLYVSAASPCRSPSLLWWLTQCAQWPAARWEMQAACRACPCVLAHRAVTMHEQPCFLSMTHGTDILQRVCMPRAHEVNVHFVADCVLYCTILS